MSLKYYHNPRCSKSRQALELLQARSINFDVLLYLEEKLKPQDIEDLISKYLKCNPQAKLENLLRKKEAEFIALAEKPAPNEVKKWAKLICNNPKSLERPVLVGPRCAVIGRPPQDILSSKDLS